MSKVIDVVKALKDGSGIPYAYDHFAEGESPDPPFVVYRYPGTNNFGADNAVYLPVNEVDIELYTDRKSPNTEKSLEALLDEAEIFWQKSEQWIDTELLYEVVYTFEEVAI